MHVTIDRPRALNALNRDAVERLHELFQRAERDDAAACYLLRGHGSRAFCAGGDVRAVREMVVRGDVDGAIAFFNREFALNAALHALRKPSACVWNGVVMGGGAGLSCYCPVRVATDATVFAMPECAIGLYPDVGAGWFLNALCGHAYATCLSLTGARVRGIDCKRIGLATHYVTMEVWDRETRGERGGFSARGGERRAGRTGGDVVLDQRTRARDDRRGVRERRHVAG
jgi:enoyl-CoA hydratase/carnithine racemase